MIYFVADTHFNHENIIKYCNRPFINKDDMNEKLIKSWNETVTDKDIVYHLGDLILGDSTQWKDILKDLKGKKYLILGNHDHKSVATYEALGFKVLENAPVLLEKEKLILSHVPLPDKDIPKGYINVHGHIHNKKLHDVSTKSGFVQYLPEEYSEKLHICVSVDVTDFRPISIENLYLK